MARNWQDVFQDGQGFSKRTVSQLAGIEVDLATALAYANGGSQPVPAPSGDATGATDAAAIQAALATLVARPGRGRLQFQPGIYYVDCTSAAAMSIGANKSIDIAGLGVGAVNAAAGVTIIRRVAGTNPILDVEGTGDTGSLRGYCSARDIEFDGGSLAGTAIRLNRVNEINFDRVRVRGAVGCQRGIYATQIWNSIFRACYFTNCGNGTSYPAVEIGADAGNASGASDTVHFIGCEWENCTGTELRLTGDRTQTTPCRAITVTDFKQERQVASQDWPVFDLDYADRVVISHHAGAGMSTSDSTSKFCLITGDSTVPNALTILSDLAIVQKGTAAVNLVDIARGRLLMNDVLFDTNMSSSSSKAIRIQSTVADGAVALTNVRSLQVGQLVEDDRLTANVAVQDPSKLSVRVPPELLGAVAATLLGSDVCAYGPFPATGTTTVRGTVTLPYNWLGNTAVTVRARFMVNATSGNVRLSAIYRGGPSGPTDFTASTSATGTVTGSAASPANRLLVADFPLTLSTANKPGDEVSVSFTRLGDDAADTATVDLYLVGLTLIGERAA